MAKHEEISEATRAEVRYDWGRDPLRLARRAKVRVRQSGGGVYTIMIVTGRLLTLTLLALIAALVGAIFRLTLAEAHGMRSVLIPWAHGQDKQPIPLRSGCWRK